MPDARAILLDIEGTTTPVEFVYEVLFPFARRRLADFLRRHSSDEGVRADIDVLRAEHRADAERGHRPPPWRDDSGASLPESAARYARWLMNQDRKSTALKSLQGKIWEGGYRGGGLRGQVYADVAPAFARWRQQGRRLYIFSSGSVLAQKLLFAHTTEGDLSGYLDGYFDTTTGVKSEAGSYRYISAKIGVPVAQVLFVSDVTAELDAARAAGMQTALCLRPGRPAPDSPAHLPVHTFDVIFP